MKLYYDLEAGAGWVQITNPIIEQPITDNSIDYIGTCVIKLAEFEGALFDVWKSRDFTLMKVEDESANIIFQGFLENKVFTQEVATFTLVGFSKIAEWKRFKKDYVLAEGIITAIDFNTITVAEDDGVPTAYAWDVDYWRDAETDVGLMIIDNTKGTSSVEWQGLTAVAAGEHSTTGVVANTLTKDYVSGSDNTNCFSVFEQISGAGTNEDLNEYITMEVGLAGGINILNKIQKITIDFKTICVNEAYNPLGSFLQRVDLQIYNYDSTAWETLGRIHDHYGWPPYIVRDTKYFQVVDDTYEIKSENFDDPLDILDYIKDTNADDDYDEITIRFKQTGYLYNYAYVYFNIDYVSIKVEYFGTTIAPIMTPIRGNGASTLTCGFKDDNWQACEDVIDWGTTAVPDISAFLFNLKYNSVKDVDTISGNLNQNPLGICWDGTNFYVTDGTDDSVYKYTAAWAYVGLIADLDTLSGNLNQDPYGIVWDGTYFYVCDNNAGAVYKYTSAWAYDSVIDIDTISGNLNQDPLGIEWDGTFFYISDANDTSIYKYTSAWAYVGVYDVNALSGQIGCYGIVWDGTYFYVVDETDDHVYKFTSAWVYVSASNVNTISGGLNATPGDMCWDGTYFYVTDDTDDSVYKYAFNPEIVDAHDRINIAKIVSAGAAQPQVLDITDFSNGSIEMWCYNEETNIAKEVIVYSGAVEILKVTFGADAKIDFEGDAVLGTDPDTDIVTYAIGYTHLRIVVNKNATSSLWINGVLESELLVTAENNDTTHIRFEVGAACTMYVSAIGVEADGYGEWDNVPVHFTKWGVEAAGDNRDYFKIGQNTNQIIADVSANCELSITSKSTLTKYMARNFRGTHCIDPLRSVIELEGVFKIEDHEVKVLILTNKADMTDSGESLTQAQYDRSWEYEDKCNQIKEYEVYGSSYWGVYYYLRDETAANTSKICRQTINEEVTTEADAYEICKTQLDIWKEKQPSIIMKLLGTYPALKVGETVEITMVRPTVAAADYPIRRVTRTPIGADILTTIYAGLGSTPADEKLKNEILGNRYRSHQAKINRLIGGSGGAPGIQGLKGDTGLTGAIGLTGATGANGSPVPFGTVSHLFDIASAIGTITTRTTHIGASVANGDGWYILNGTTTTDAVANGAAQEYALPDLITLNQFLRANSTQGLATGTGGAGTHTLTNNELPANGYWCNVGGNAVPVAGGYTMKVVTGGGVAHENKPPYKDAIPIIKIW